MKLPPSPDGSDFIEGTHAAAADLALLPPVERALLYADQRASFARGLLTEKAELVDAEPRIAADPVNVLAAYAGNWPATPRYARKSPNSGKKSSASELRPSYA